MNTASSIKQTRMIEACTLGCASHLVITDLLLPEGLVRQCPSCGQLLSNCSQEQFENSLKIWDTASGTNATPGSSESVRFRVRMERRLKLAKKLLPPAASGQSVPTLLDVACSSGDFLDVAKTNGFDVQGVEPAPEAARTCRDAGFDVFEGFLEDAKYKNESFDVITVFELIEHITDPVSLLRECSRILKPNGVLILNTPNANSWTRKVMRHRWEGFSLTLQGGHISWFSPESMAVLAERSGFSIESIASRNVRFFEIYDTNKLVYRVAKILSQLCEYPARALGQGHEILVYLRKK